MATAAEKQPRRSRRLISSTNRAASRPPSSLPLPEGVSVSSTAPSCPNREANLTSRAISAFAAAEALESDSSISLKPPASSGEGRRRRRRRTLRPQGYRGPEYYSHLPANPIHDILAPNLVVLIIGLNPGVAAALKGRAYSAPNNHFWRLLHESGLTPRRLRPEDDLDLPRLSAVGLTNIVARPTHGLAQLSKTEIEAGVARLDAKVRRWRPEVVIMDGKAQFKAVFKSRYGREPTGECRYGWVGVSENIGVGTPGAGEHAHEEPAQGVDYSGEWNGARVFIAPSSSGASPMFKGEREAGWREVGKWAEQRRAGKMRLL